MKRLDDYWTDTAPRATGRTSDIRVVLFSGNYNYVMDGPVRALNRLVGYLERNGIAALVVAPTTDTPVCEPVGRLISAPSVALPGRSEYRIGLGIPAAVRKEIAAFKPTLFHLAAPDFLGYRALRLAQSMGVPAVASFHTRFDTYAQYYGAAWLQKYLTRYLQYFYRQCEHLYVPSESMANVLREEGMGKDLRLWSRGVDCQMFTPAKRDMAWRRSMGVADDELLIAFVGRLVLEKGLATFAHVTDTLTARGVRHRALIVGDGPERAWFQQRLPTAVFTGFLKDNALSRAYASADAFFNPSHTETFGQVTLEAMASGLPAVCADATGSRSLVVPGTSGYLVPFAQEQDYADALGCLAADPALRAGMGIAARNRAMGFDWDAVMSALVGHYTEAVADYAAARDMAQRAPQRKLALSQATG